MSNNFSSSAFQAPKSKRRFFLKQSNIDFASILVAFVSASLFLTSNLTTPRPPAVSLDTETATGCVWNFNYGFLIDTIDNRSAALYRGIRCTKNEFVISDADAEPGVSAIQNQEWIFLYNKTRLVIYKYPYGGITSMINLGAKIINVDANEKVGDQSLTSQERNRVEEAKKIRRSVLMDLAKK